MKIYFILGSIGIYFLILFLDKYFQGLISKNQIKSSIIQEVNPSKIHNSQQDELEIGLKSLQSALDDNILTNEEYEKLKQEHIDRYHPS